VPQRITPKSNRPTPRAPRNAATLQRSRSSSSLRRLERACDGLHREPDILDHLRSDLARAGLVGEDRAATLAYVAGISALLQQPASLVLKGPSSAGKNKVADTALAFLPDHAVKRLTSVSERALFYTDEEIKHRLLYITEGDGVSSRFQASVVRSLLSEGRLRYDTVDHTSKKGLHGKSIDKEGPAAFLTTTTFPSLDNELETRLLSVPVDDSRAQTRSCALRRNA
jgi:hypothetical protein